MTKLRPGDLVTVTTLYGCYLRPVGHAPTAPQELDPRVDHTNVLVVVTVDLDRIPPYVHDVLVVAALADGRTAMGWVIAALLSRYVT